MTENTENKSGTKRRFIGVVVNNKMQKTILVMVENNVLHPIYKKYIKRRAKFMAHDEKSECKIGDTVEIQESKPISRHKRWVVKRIVERTKEI